MEAHLPSPQQRIRIGCAGWSIPSSASSRFDIPGSHLQRYSQVFNCCEINSSFYRPHQKTTWKRWAESVPEEFLFSVKAPKIITHEAKLKCGSEVLLDFLQQATLLGEKLGPILIQLPPSLNFELSTAGKFLSLLRGSYGGDVAWEPRHRSWFEENANDLLKDFQIARVAADPACIETGTNPGGATNLAYFRCHGSPRKYYSGYNSEYLNVLSLKLRDLAATARVWCVFDNTASGNAIQNALELKSKVQELD